MPARNPSASASSHHSTTAHGVGEQGFVGWAAGCVNYIIVDGAPDRRRVRFLGHTQAAPYPGAMVVIQVKRSDTDVFLVESTISESNDVLVRRLVSLSLFKSST